MCKYNFEEILQVIIDAITVECPMDIHFEPIGSKGPFDLLYAKGGVTILKGEDDMIVLGLLPKHQKEVSFQNMCFTDAYWQGVCEDEKEEEEEFSRCVREGIIIC